MASSCGFAAEYGGVKKTCYLPSASQTPTDANKCLL
jgi:hypothetical protein